MKTSTLLRSIPIVSAMVCSCLAMPLSQAQQPEEKAAMQSPWDKLQEANSRIKACHVVWKRVFRVAPIAEADPDKWAANAFAAARKRGLSEKQAQQEAQSERREAVRSRQGRTINSTLDFVRVGNVVLCRTDYLDPAYHGLQLLEYSDGIDSLEAQMRVQDKEVSPTGSLMRDPQEVLKMSAGGFQVARMLLGIALNQDFGLKNSALSPNNSSLKVLASGNVSLEREARMENRQSQDPDALTFAKEGLYPVSAERFGIALLVRVKEITMKKDKVPTRVVASGYKQYPGGIWFPSKVVETSSPVRIEYFLVKVSFNDEVNPDDVRLPNDLRVNDLRCGIGLKGTYYKVQEGKVLSEEEAKARIEAAK